MNRNITAILLIILAGGLYYTVTQGMLDETKAIRAVNTQYVSAITNAQQLIKVRDQVLKDYNNLSQDDRERLDKMVPNTVDNIRLIIDLNNIALKHGFSLKGIKAVASTDSQQKNPARSGVAAPITGSSRSLAAKDTSAIAIPTLDSVTVSFAVTAPYQQFITLLQDLESNLRIMDITRLSLSSNDTGVYEWSVELKTYWLRTQ